MLTRQKNSVLWCGLKEKNKEQLLFDVDGKEIFSNSNNQTKPKVGEKTDKKGGKE